MSIDIVIQDMDRLIKAKASSLSLPTERGRTHVLNSHEDMILTLSEGDIILKNYEPVSVIKSKGAENDNSEEKGIYKIRKWGVARINNISSEKTECHIMLAP